MPENDNSEFNEYTTILLNFLMDFLIDSTEDFSDILIIKSKKVIYKSKWQDAEEITHLIVKWQNSEISPTFILQNNKFIKLHVSPFNLIYRSIKGQKALIGVKFQVKTKWVEFYAIIIRTSMMQSILTSLKDIILLIIELGQNMSGIVVEDTHNLQMKINLVKNKMVINSFIESLKNIQIVCNYTDRGDSIKLNFKYEKKEQKIYPDYMYK